MSIGRFENSPIDPDERANLIPAIPKAVIQKMAHLKEAWRKVKENAHSCFQSFRPHRLRVIVARKSLARAVRTRGSKIKTYERDLEKRERLATVRSRRQGSLKSIFTFANAPTILLFIACSMGAFGLFCTEILSATLLMQHSGWGLTRYVVVMIALVATWVLQPFFGTKFLVAVMPSRIALLIERSIATIGLPMALVGFWAFSAALGPMAEAPEFSMTVSAATETVKPISKTTYLWLAMVSMWLGSYAASFFAGRFLDDLWPPCAEPRSDYSYLTRRIEQTERELAELDSIIVDANEALESEALLENYYVDLCLAYLDESQEELKTLQDAVRLSPFSVPASAN